MIEENTLQNMSPQEPATPQMQPSQLSNSPLHLTLSARSVSSGWSLDWAPALGASVFPRERRGKRGVGKKRSSFILETNQKEIRE